MAENETTTPTEWVLGEPVPLVAVMQTLAAQDPDRLAVTCGAEVTTRGDLESRANRLAHAYEALGVGEGDTVTVALPNGVEHLAACLATWKLGAVPNLVSHRLPLPERAAILELASPALVVGVDASVHPEYQCVAIGFEPDASVSDAPIDPVRLSPSMAQMTSSGSTGRPKLIVLGSKPLTYPGIAAAGIGMTENGVTLVPGPLYHTMGFQYSWLALTAGCHVIMLPKFDAVEALEAIRNNKVDFVGLVPTMMSRMARAIEAEPDRFDLSSLNRVWHGAAACPLWVKDAWIALVGPEKIMEGYAATDGWAGSIISGTEWLEHRGSVGKVMGSVKILGPDGEELPAGEVGEIYAAPPPLPPGMTSFKYIGAESRMHGDMLSVGDLGWLDEDGYLYISDRRVDMIIVGGANIFPAEIEAAIDEHPQVLSSIVVGLPDEDLGQRIHAVVQARDGLTSDELVAFLSDRLVRYKLPRSIRFVDEPLRDDAGKARRSAIRDREAELLSAAKSE